MLMDLNAQQLEILMKEFNKKDLFAGYVIRPLYIAKDDDGDLRSFIGSVPVKDEKGHWGGDNSIPYDDFTEEETSILSCFEVGHQLPFDIFKMIRTKKVQTVGVHKLWSELNEKGIAFVNEVDRESLIECILSETVRERVSTISPKGTPYSEAFKELNYFSFEYENFDKSIVNAVLRTSPEVIILELKKDLLGLQEIEELIRSITHTGYLLYVVKTN